MAEERLNEGLEIKIRIQGFNKQVADALIARTPMVPHERSGRIGWSYTILRVAGVQVAVLNCNRINDPLHMMLDLNALKHVDPDWQCTLETLGVLT